MLNTNLKPPYATALVRWCERETQQWVSLLDCFLPLHVFSGDELVTTLLRPSNIDGAKYAGAILKIIVSKIRERWPNIRVIFSLNIS